jgi:hypothetical protein
MRRRIPRPDVDVTHRQQLSEINEKLNAYLRAHCPMTAVDGWESRKKLPRERLLDVFREAGCGWVHGDGTVVVAVNGRHPEERIR